MQAIYVSLKYFHIINTQNILSCHYNINLILERDVIKDWKNGRISVSL
jgi:hypothetical protein